MNYKNKYLKYKIKYLNTKKNYGGSNKLPPSFLKIDDIIVKVTVWFLFHMVLVVVKMSDLQ